MGRVSRILKAVTDKPAEARSPALERDLAATDHDLPRLIACWSAMPPHFKQTVMSLVEIVEAQRRPAPAPESPPVVPREVTVPPA